MLLFECTVTIRISGNSIPITKIFEAKDITEATKKIKIYIQTLFYPLIRLGTNYAVFPTSGDNEGIRVSYENLTESDIESTSDRLMKEAMADID